MKKKILLPLILLATLSSCDKETSTCNHVDENKDHLCDLCNEKISEHIDENKDHICDYCNQQASFHIDEVNNHYCDICEEKISEHIDANHDYICDRCGEHLTEPEEYAEWPEKEIQDLVIVVSGSEVKIPQYGKADDIEINEDDLAEYGYFSIYCYTLNSKSELEYKQILINNGWEVETSKDENGYYNAWDSKREVWLNFGYFTEYSDLEICITASWKTLWPGDYIAESVQYIAPGSKTTIPQFEADTVFATYYPEYKALAINAYTFKDTIIEDYTAILENANWTVSYNDSSDEWNAVSKDKDIELHFYIDETKAEFNVDVLHHEEAVEGWPYEEIAAVVEEMGATGEVPAFTGENTGFLVETDWFPPAIFIYTDKAKQAQAAADYNQYIQDLGFVYVGDMYGDPMYAKPGTTLAIRALVMMDVLEIEMFKLDEPAK